MGNALAAEKSPYLLEHAENPVDWLPWGDVAFARARARDVPLFVSVGYSACHWCHVMARESFEDAGVAYALNRDFVPVKVDREERPDVDALLMRACQLMTGSGGWPLTVFLTPERAPFFAGTYFPRETKGGHLGLVTLLERVTDAWRDERATLMDAGAALIGHIEASQETEPGTMRAALLDRARRELGAAFDPVFGGFGHAPKFPTPHALMFLMRYARENRDDGARAMVETTLRAMARGGMNDQVGGGFCRYSTDRQWLVPHFEKMLYDNALLALLYAEAFLNTGDAAFAAVARETAEYLLRDMRGAHGGFFASQDADTGGREGAYYLFTPEEVRRAVGDGAEALCAHLNIEPGGNFEGRSIPNRLNDAGIDAASVAPARERLHAYRRARMALRTDDKVLTAWNALAIAALAKTATALNRPGDLDAARAALSFIDEHLTDGRGGLYARWRDGEARHRATLDDYAALGWALIALYDATLDMRYVRRAADVVEQVVQRFAADDGLGYYLSEADGALPVRPREADDGAMPSGNAMLGYCLVRLASLTGDAWHWRLADGQLRFLAGAAERAPSGHAFGLIAGMRAVYPETTVTCEAATDEDAEAFRAMIHARFLPNAAAMLDSGPRTTYQICHDRACERPLESLESCAARLDALMGDG